jgi:hypothetical protein
LSSRLWWTETILPETYGLSAPIHLVYLAQLVMQVVEMKKVQDEIEPVIDFLRTCIKGSLRVKGSQIEIEEATHDEVKLLLHKFLH